jgi:DnaJ-class molecular chaperone
MAEDYYKSLGIPKTATADEIRKAYRKLARANHPDAKPDDPQASTKFKEIQDAYDVLSDAKKRQQYDQFGVDFSKMGPGSGPTGRGPGPGGSGTMDFSDFFGPGGVDLGEMLRGGGQRRTKRSPVRGEDLRATVQVSFETSITGGSVDVQVDRGSKLDTLSVRVPAGLNDGQVIRLGGQGNAGSRSGESGDLLLKIEILPHRYFRREGSHLLLDLPITPFEAVLGTKVEVPTLSEGAMVVKIPPGTSSGKKLRLSGKGVLDSQTKQVGDQLVVIKIVLPKTISDRDKALYEQLAESGSTVREGLW